MTALGVCIGLAIVGGLWVLVRAYVRADGEHYWDPYK